MRDGPERIAQPLSHPGRRLDWDGCYNARDVRGYETTGGRTVRWRALLRADNLSRLTPEGRDALIATGVRTIIDLRSPYELDIDPPPFASPSTDPPITYLNLEAINDAAMAVAEQRGTVLGSYCAIVDGCRQETATIVTAVARSPTGAVLIHCHAGKDRTGVIVALLLALAGVPHDVIAAEYALSETYLRSSLQSDQETSDGNAPLIVDGATMLGTPAHVEVQHGGVEAYLLESGVEPADIARIRERLLGQAPPGRTVQSGMANVLDILHERGFIQQISGEPALRERIGVGPITLYNGYDATADSLHVGNLVSIMMLTWFQRCGHRPIALLGGGTTLVGDPSGRQTSRPMLDEQEIDRRIQTIKEQFGRFLDFDNGRALLVNNAQWLTKLRFVDFMRDIGSRFSVNEVLRLEAYDTRLKAGGMTFLELSYVLMQSYDFLRLFEDYNCILQTGGSDQWGNSIMGADLVRRVTGGEAFVLTVPLIETSSGRKMGKSEAGAVWLSAEKLSPYDYYQFWRNTPDADVERFLAIFTFLPMEEVRRLGSREGVELNEAKDILALEATTLVHGEEEARRAEKASRALFTLSGDEDDVPTIAIDCAHLENGIALLDLFREAGLVSSTNEARRQIQQGGLSVNGQRVSDPKGAIDRSSFQDGAILLRRGKKDYRRVICREDSS